ARFRRHASRVWVQESIVTVEYRRFPFLEQPVNWRWPIAEIRLNGSIPWEVEFRDGAAHLNADLAQLQLRSLDILGGANQIQLALSKPLGTTFIYISGGINQSAIHVPSTAEISLRVSGGSTNLRFDGQRFGAIGGETSLESPNFDRATSRYDICIAGEAHNLTIGRKG
ncbi:MAG: cell wall-active antibiotics response protein, partial [Chloroflexi bacterium]|nr:cell wall-active antibiotics response protein [Chloroflexota bacterium]